MSGRLNTLRASAPARAVNPQCVALTKRARPNSPTTIDGTEPMSSWQNRMILVSGPDPAYSAR